MLTKNSFVAGALAGVVFPVIAWFVAHALKYTELLINKPSLPYFAAIALNLVILRFCLKWKLDKTGKGLILTTFVALVLIFVLKIQLIR